MGLRGTISTSRVSMASVVLSVAILAAACTGDSSEDLTLQELATQAFHSRPSVDHVELTETPGGKGAAVAMDVVMDESAPTEHLIAAAELARTFSEENVADERWSTHLYVGQPTEPGDGDVTISGPLQVEIYPHVRESAGADVQAAITFRDLPGVLSIAMAQGTPYVTATDARSLRKLITAGRELPFWSEGGSFQSENGRIRLMDAPSRVTAAQLDAILRAATAHPTGEFWLEAAATGERRPELYVNKVTEDEGADITKRFSVPALRSDNTEGFTLDYYLRANGVDSYGTFGEVPPAK